MLVTSGQRRVIRRPEVEVRVLPLRAPRARSVRFPGGDGCRKQPDGDVASTEQGTNIGGPVLDVVLRLVRRMDSRLHPSSLACPSKYHTGLSSSPGGLLPRGPHQNRTRRFPPSGSSADVAHGDAPQIRTRIRGTGRGYRSNNATNLGQGSTTFRISGDMSPDVNAPVMGPFESSHQHGPPLLGRVRGPTRSPTSSLVCSPPTPSLPSAAAPVVPGRWPTLSLVRQGGRRASQVPGPSSSSVP